MHNDAIRRMTMTTRFQRITPFLWFKQQAQEAVDYYVSVFANSRILTTTHYSKESAQASGQPEGAVMTISFELDGQGFTALNGGPHFTITEAVSFVVNCADQNEIDYYWNKLTQGGDEKAQICGWLKDRFGVSWQVVPAELPQLLSDPHKAGKVMDTLMQMKKLDLGALRKAAA
jgi:predicted 3-demethylubiquinone-9 3-methyltransferase (glyoxalase superfamily)